MHMWYCYPWGQLKSPLALDYFHEHTLGTSLSTEVISNHWASLCSFLELATLRDGSQGCRLSQYLLHSATSWSDASTWTKAQYHQTSLSMCQRHHCTFKTSVSVQMTQTTQDHLWSRSNGCRQKLDLKWHGWPWCSVCFQWRDSGFCLRINLLKNTSGRIHGSVWWAPLGGLLGVPRKVW